MIIRFYSYEDAAIHVGFMRSQGHDAAMLDEAMGSLYGPVFSNGFRVWVSDEAVADPEDADRDQPPPAQSTAPAEQSATSSLADAIRLIVGALICLGVVVVGLGLAALVIRTLSDLRNVLLEGEDAGILVSSAWVLIALLGTVVLFAWIGPMMVGMTGSLRDKTSPFGRTVRAIAALWVLAQLVGLGTALVQVIWRLCGGASSSPL